MYHNKHFCAHTKQWRSNTPNLVMANVTSTTLLYLLAQRIDKTLAARHPCWRTFWASNDVSELSGQQCMSASSSFLGARASVDQKL